MTSNRLSRIVRVKKLVEQARATELSERQASLDEATDSLRRTHDELEALDQQQTVNNPTPGELKAAAAYQEHLEHRAESQRDDVVEQQRQVEEDRDQVRELWQERRLLEGVQDRLVERERVEEQKSESRTSDARAINSHSRRRQGNGGGE